MIEIGEFRWIVQVLTEIAFGKTIELPHNLTPRQDRPRTITELLHTRSVFPHSYDFLHEVSTDTDFIFLIPRLSRYPLMIERSTFHLEEPPVFMTREGIGKIPLINFSSIILLTEYAFHLYLHSAYTYEYTSFDVYPVMRQYFTLLCKEFTYPNKVWVNAAQSCFILVFSDEEKMCFVAKNRDTLSEVVAQLQLNASDAPKGKPYPTEHLKNAFIADDIVRGYMPLPGRKAPITAAVYSEEDPPAELNALLEKAAALAAKMTPEIINRLAQKASLELTVAAHSQVDRKTNMNDFEMLFKSIQLSSIEFVDEDIMLIFESPTVFNNHKIYVQVNSNFDIDEVTLH